MEDQNKRESIFSVDDIESVMTWIAIILVLDYSVPIFMNC